MPAAPEFRHLTALPAFDGLKVHRAALVDRLHGEIGKKLVVVIAPPGYGKTTLLADFAAHTDLPVAWAQVSDADRDPMHLAQLLTEALTKRFRRLQGRIRLAALADAPPKALARALLDAVTESIPETFVLAVDDAHVLNESDQALELLDTLLLESPGHMTVLMAGRDLPGISMARLVVDSNMAGLGSESLAFNEQEIERLAEASGRPALSPDEVQHLAEHTQGWPAGVMLSLRIAGGDAGSLLRGRPMVYEYLGSVAYAGQEPALREFMLGAAVLPVMTAESCDRVLEQDDSQRHLARLVHRGLFITIHEHTPRSYTFHDQFREFLLHTAALEQPQRLQALRRRAAGYLQDSGLPEAAFRCLVEAEAFADAGQLASEHAYELFSTGRSATLARWADTLQQHGVQPVNLHLLLATSFSDRDAFDDAERHLSIARQRLQEGGSDASEREQIQAANVEGWLAYRTHDLPRARTALQAAGSLLQDSGDARAHASHLRLKALTFAELNADRGQVLEWLEQAFNLLPPGDGLPHMKAWLLLDRMRFQAEAGDLKTAAGLGEQARSLLTELGSPGPLATCVNNLAVIAHLEGRYLDALDLFQQARQYAHQAANPVQQIEIAFGQADLFNDLGLAWQAGDLYGEGLTSANRLHNEHWMLYGFLGTSTLHRRWGNHNQALEWLKRAEDLAGTGPSNPALLVQRCALDCERDAQQARRQLQALLASGPLLHAVRQLALYFLTRAEYLAGNLEAAARTFDQALDECLRSGSLQSLASELMTDPELLSGLSRLLPNHRLLQPLLQLVDSMEAISQNLRLKTQHSAEAPELEIRALGNPEILLNGTRVTALEPLPRQVLFFLVDNGPVARDVLLESIWPGISAGRQLASLYTATHSLRKALGQDIIHIEGAIYRVNPSIEIVYDVAIFEHAASIAETALPGDPRRYFALTEAINVFAGPYLPDFNTGWSIERRESLDRIMLRLLTLHAESALALGREERALDSLRQALRMAPLRDDINLRYLELLGELGRRDELSRHYQTYTRLLAGELGLDPPAEARQLYKRLIS